MRLRGLVTAAVLLATSLLSLSASAQIADSARKQIEQISALKRSLTPGEKKMSFSLVLLERDAQHTLPPALARLVKRDLLDTGGNAVVEVDGFLTSSLLNSSAMKGVEKVDGQVPAHAFASGKVRAHVSPSQLLKLAADPDVKSLRVPSGFTTNVGSVTSQGYVAMGANKVVATGITGAGVRVGVLSDSASAARVSALIASGDLPSDTIVVAGQAGPTSGGDEGAAMMEIVHDMAPNAKLVFATAYSSESAFAANIRTLRFTYHCDIIVDDITYFAEAAFQDDVVARAVNDVTADGALYFSSAANSGNLTDGTSGTWEGDFLAGVPGSGLLAGDGTLHNFGTVASPVYYDTLTAGSTVISLKWSDALGAAADDYDLYILNAAGTAVVDVSADTQDGTQDPLEIVGNGTTYAVGDRIVVVQYAGAARALRVDTNRGRLSIATDGSTFGHNAAANTFSSAAVYWNAARRGPAPFTGGSTNPDESFSSDGPRKIFYNPDGSPITPGNYLFATAGGKTLIKPDAAGADGVSTATPGFQPFFGTSAAAPHLAGVAALIKSANASLTNIQIRNIMISTTLDNMEAGVDRDSGYGIVSASKAVAAAQAMAVNQ